MKNLMRYIAENWYWILIGIAGTRLSVEAAYVERGGFAVGGEWLVLPMVLLAVELYRGFRYHFMVYLTDGQYDEGED